MANPEHLAKLNEGVEAWNRWREQNPDETELDLSGADLQEASLSQANLKTVSLKGAKLQRADLSGAILRNADLSFADLKEANLSGADASEVYFRQAILFSAILRDACFKWAFIFDSRLANCDLRNANFERAKLQRVDLSNADASHANFTRAILRGSILIGTNFENANLTNCDIYGISAWDLRLTGATQANLIITPKDDRAEIQVDNIEVAQFIYLLLNNERIRHVIDTITSKVVLILGRFTDERKIVLDAIRDELRKRDYLPILFDFQKPDSKDLTGTVTTLANLARFIIADLTDPSGVPYELATIIPGTVVPVQTILLDGQQEFAMFADLKRRYHWVLQPCKYDSQESLLQHIDDGVIRPAEVKAKELTRK